MTNLTSSSILAILLSLTPPATASLRLDGGTTQGWDTSNWRLQVDGVMGGKSSGSLSFPDESSILAFNGDIVLDGGGFSSVRKTRFGVVDLTGYAGIEVELESTAGYDSDDGNDLPLGMHLQFHDTSSYFGYASAFAIPLTDTAGESMSVYMPLSSFDRGSRIGYQCNGCALDLSSVNEMDLYVLFQKGPFNVRVKSITAVDSPRSIPIPAVSIGSGDYVKELIEGTIESGGKLYDYGYTELCNAVYRSTLNTLLAAGYNNDFTVMSQTIKGMICQGLQRAEPQGKTDTAWTLRYTMDGLLEEMGYSEAGSGWRPDASLVAEGGAVQCRGVASGAYYTGDGVTNAPTTAPPSRAPSSSPSSREPTLAPIYVTLSTTSTTADTTTTTTTVAPSTMPRAALVSPTLSPSATIEITSPENPNTATPTNLPSTAFIGIQSPPNTATPTHSPSALIETTTLLPSGNMIATIKPMITGSSTNAAANIAADYPSAAALPDSSSSSSAVGTTVENEEMAEEDTTNATFVDANNPMAENSGARVYHRNVVFCVGVWTALFTFMLR